MAGGLPAFGSGNDQNSGQPPDLISGNSSQKPDVSLGQHPDQTDRHSSSAQNTEHNLNDSLDEINAALDSMSESTVSATTVPQSPPASPSSFPFHISTTLYINSVRILPASIRIFGPFCPNISSLLDQISEVGIFQRRLAVANYNWQLPTQLGYLELETAPKSGELFVTCCEEIYKGWFQRNVSRAKTSETDDDVPASRVHVHLYTCEGIESDRSVNNDERPTINKNSNLKGSQNESRPQDNQHRPATAQSSTSSSIPASAPHATNSAPSHADFRTMRSQPRERSLFTLTGQSIGDLIDAARASPSNGAPPSALNSTSQATQPHQAQE